MGFQRFLITILMLFFSVTALAKGKYMPVTHYYARVTASVLNEIQTMDNYQRWLSQVMAKDQMEKFKKLVDDYGIDGSEKFPKFHFDKNKVYMDKQNYMIINDKTVVINGYSFKPINKPLVEVVEEVCKKLKCSKTTAEFSLFPKAHAGSGKNLLLSALIGGAAGYGFCAFTGGVCNPTTGALVGAAGFGLLNYFMSSNNRQQCGSNCTVSCDGANYDINPQGGMPQPIIYQTAYTGGMQSMPPSCDTNPGYVSCMQTDLNRDLYGGTPAPGCNPYAPGPVPMPGGPTLQGDMGTTNAEKDKVDTGRSPANKKK